MVLALLVAAGVISYAPLLTARSQAQRDLDIATRAAVMQVDRDMLRIGQVVFIEEDVESVFGQMMQDMGYTLVSKELTLNAAEKSLRSDVELVLHFRPFFFGAEADLVLQRNSTVQLFWDSAGQEN